MQPQHLSSFQLLHHVSARDEIIPSLRHYFETDAFRDCPAEAAYVECPLDYAALERLKPLLSLIFDGVCCCCPMCPSAIRLTFL